jgi:large subunit ribosomal protein L2
LITHTEEEKVKPSGGRSPVSPWGQSAKGLKTRRPKRSDNLIITRRKKRKK